MKRIGRKLLIIEKPINQKKEILKQFMKTFVKIMHFTNYYKHNGDNYLLVHNTIISNQKLTFCCNSTIFYVIQSCNIVRNDTKVLHKKCQLIIY